MDENGTKDHERNHGLNQGRKVFRLVGGRVLRSRKDFGGEGRYKDGTCDVT